MVISKAARISASRSRSAVLRVLRRSAERGRGSTSTGAGARRGLDLLHGLGSRRREPRKAPAVGARRSSLRAVENIGSGPGLNVEASVSGTSIPVEARTEHQTSARLAGLGEGNFRALLIELPFWKELWSFTLTIEYSDVAGKGWRTTALFLRDTGRYDVVTISECEQKRPLSDMVKPVPAE
jgi:hypothetical protein